jgi:hypothetical protein
VQSAKKLAPPGLTREQVEAKLGKGEWAHRHGLLITIPESGLTSRSQSTGQYEQWALDFTFPDGIVAVLFKNTNSTPTGAPSFRTIGVTYRQRLTSQSGNPK